MSTRKGLPNWVDERARKAGPPDREIRFRAAARAIAESILRTRPTTGSPDCPVMVEGIKDERALQVLGFSGTIEKVNRGWDRSRLVAYLHDTYGTRNAVDSGPPLILLMDWDRTGGRLQTGLRDRLMALDVPVDEELRRVLLKVMTPEGRPVESLAPHAKSLIPMIEEQLEALG